MLVDEIPGARFQLLFGQPGRECEIEIASHDGYVGQLAEGITTLAVEVPKIFEAFDIDGQKNLIPKKDWHRESRRRSQRYQSRFRIEPDLRGTLCTKFPNNFRLIHIDNKLVVRMWEVALISQNGKFFVTSTKLYEVGCFRHMGAFSCPYFEEPPHIWPQFVSILRERIDVDDLPSRELYYLRQERDRSSIPDGQGEVLFWSPASGCGAIITRDGKAKVHWRQVTRDASSLQYLKQGELVTYTSLDAPGPGTGFEYEAQGVHSY